MTKHQINPSRDFVERTLVKITTLDRQRAFISKLLFLVLIFSPLIIREVWLAARGDYFSVARFPFQETVLSTYSFFLSGFAFYMLLGASAAVAVLYSLGYRRLRRLSFALRFFTQIFHQLRLKI